MSAVMCMVFLFLGLHLISFCLFSLGVSNLSLHQNVPSLQKGRGSALSILWTSLADVRWSEWEEGESLLPRHRHSDAAQLWSPQTLPQAHQIQLSTSRVRASRHEIEKYLLPIQSFRTDSLFTYTAISSNHIVLIYSGGAV